MLQIILSMQGKKETILTPAKIFKGAVTLPLGVAAGVYNICPPGKIDIETAAGERSFENVDSIEIKLPTI